MALGLNELTLYLWTVLNINVYLHFVGGLSTEINSLATGRWGCNRKWQDYVYIQCEYKSTKQKIKHLLREENKVKENKIS